MLNSLRFWLFVRNLGGSLIWLGSAVIMGGVIGFAATIVPESVSTSELVGYMCLIGIPFAFGLDSLITNFEHRSKEKKMQAEHQEERLHA